MDDLHVTIEPERIVTSTLILRSWSAAVPARTVSAAS
jgi:hypothetical protein